MQGRIKTVLDYAIVNEYRGANNPALWSGYLDTQLPAPKKIKTVVHHYSVPYMAPECLSDAVPAEVTVHARGKTFTRRVDVPRSDGRNPMTTQEGRAALLRPRAATRAPAGARLPQ